MLGSMIKRFRKHVFKFEAHGWLVPAPFLGWMTPITTRICSADAIRDIVQLRSAQLQDSGSARTWEQGHQGNLGGGYAS